MIKSRIYYLLEEHDGPSSESYILKSAYFDINTCQFEQPIQLPHPSTLASKWCSLIFPQEYLERYQNLSNSSLSNDNFDLRSVFSNCYLNDELKRTAQKSVISCPAAAVNQKILPKLLSTSPSFSDSIMKSDSYLMDETITSEDEIIDFDTKTIYSLSLNDMGHACNDLMDRSNDNQKLDNGIRRNSSSLNDYNDDVVEKK